MSGMCHGTSVLGWNCISVLDIMKEWTDKDFKMWPPVQERHEPFRVGNLLEEGKENGQRAVVPLLWGKAQRAGIVQSGGERVLWRHYCDLLILKTPWKTKEERLYMETRMKGNCLNWKRANLYGRQGRNFLMWRWQGTGTGCLEKLWVYPIPGSVWGQVEWGFEWLGLVEDVPAHHSTRKLSR